jgi:proline racemase
VTTTCLALVAISSAPGCAREEKVVDIETPAGEVEVNRNKDTGAVKVDVDKD